MPHSSVKRGNGPYRTPGSEGGPRCGPDAGIMPRAPNLPACHRKPMDRVRDSATTRRAGAFDVHVRISGGLGGRPPRSTRPGPFNPGPHGSGGAWAGDSPRSTRPLDSA